MDAKDILGLPQTPFPAAQEKRHRAPKDSQRKPDGISREVYALTGGVASLMPAVEPSHLKRPPVAEKEKGLRRGRVNSCFVIDRAESRSNRRAIACVPSCKITWEWLPFTSSARTDNLQLHHWARDVNGVPPTGDYSFATLNKSVDILKYTDEEYEKHLTDPVWTKEETDQLFDLCERFDLRFVVITDRFQPSRSMEDLKSRYYAVTRALLIARAPSFADVSGHPLVKEAYNATNEIERKRALSFVLSQTREQERRNFEIVAEAKRILESRRASKVHSAEDVELPINTTVTETAEKADGPTESVSPSNIRPTSSTTVPPTTTADSVVTPASLRNLRVYLRTHVLEQMVQEASSTAGLRTIKRVEQTLQDLGVHVKPKVPTKAVCAEHLELRKEILTLLNLQKQLQNKEAEASGNRESSYTEMPDTPKRSFRGDIDRPFVPDAGAFGGERVVKRDHKRKVPLRKMKASE